MSAPEEAAASTPPTQQPVPTIDASDPNLTFRDVFEALRRELNLCLYVEAVGTNVRTVMPLDSEGWL